MKPILVPLFALVVALAPSAQAKEAQPMSLSGFSDKAVFLLFQNDTRIGTIEAALTPDGSYSRTFVLTMAGQTVTTDFTLTADSKGLWKEMNIVAPAGTASVKRVGDRAEITVKEMTHSVVLTDKHILYDNYGPFFESYLIRAYDMEAKFQGELLGSDDNKEGIQAFFEKRKPKFTGK